MLAVIPATSARPDQNYTYTFAQETIKGTDGIILLVKPEASSLAIVVNQTGGSGHTLVVRSNETSPSVTDYMRPPYSLIEVIPTGRICNITVTFHSNSVTSVHYGAITRSPSGNYPGETYYAMYDAAFVRFSSVSGLLPGNITLRFSFYVETSSPQSSSWIPNIVLPSFVSLIGFLAIVAGVIYIECFVLIVSFFRNRSTGLSNYWKVGILLSIALSAYAVYWAYSNVLVVASA